MTQRATRRRPGATAQLDAQGWTEAALMMLAELGIEGVRVETLAKRLNVTKGSFYWHFRDRRALLDAMLAHWRRWATLDIIARLEGNREQARERLAALVQLPLRGKRSPQGADVELAIRLWARSDPAAAAALTEVDEIRLRYLRSLLEACGVPPEERAARAILAYAYMRVCATLIDSDATDLQRQCEALLVGTPAG